MRSRLVCIALLALVACKSDSGTSEKNPASSGPLTATWNEEGTSFTLSNGGKGWVEVDGARYRIKLQSEEKLHYSIAGQEGESDAVFYVDMGPVLGAAKTSQISYLAPAESLTLSAGEETVEIKLLGLSYREEIPAIFSEAKAIRFGESDTEQVPADSALWLNEEYKSWEVVGERKTFADIDWVVETQREDSPSDSLVCKGYQLDMHASMLIKAPDKEVSFEVYNTKVDVRDRRSGKTLHSLSLPPAKTCPEKTYTVERDGQQFASIYMLPADIKEAIEKLLETKAE